MRGRKISIGYRTVPVLLSVVVLAMSAWAAPQETVLHSFGNGSDGQNPYYGSLIFDTVGNLYGTTANGGIHGYGTAFELSPNGSGDWTETVLHSFGNPATQDGASPYGGLILDSDGNLYGTTAGGGIHGGGTVFELSPNGSGGWTEAVLHSFGGGTDGAGPLAGMIFDAAGNLYGTTANGGIHPCNSDGCGTVFELLPNGSGGWTETVLHSFGNPATQDGSFPFAGLIFDAAGNLYGTTAGGGIHGFGTAFQLSPREGGGYTETVVHSFGNPATSDGVSPVAGLVFDAAGNLYGTTEYGGVNVVGTMFELSPNGSGGWTETVLHNFNDDGTHGAYPFASVILDSAGNLYGTSYGGGIYDAGTAFELSPREGGGWTETGLQSFGRGTDGSFPYAGLIFDAAGNLYGTTYSGGIHGDGTLFEITP